MSETYPSVDPPLRYPTSMFYTDDSGVLAGGSRLLVIGGIKIRRHGKLMRAIRHLRDEASFTREFKFSRINRGSQSAYYALIDLLERSDARLIACVSTRPSKAGWRFYAEVTSGLVEGNINRQELAGVHMDTISTPQDVALEEVVQGMVNKRLGFTRVITSACLDSKTSDGLQVADLVAGAVAFERRRLAGESGKPNSPKARVVNRLKEAFGGIDLMDHRSDRVNIHTRRPRPARLPRVTRLEPLKSRRAG